MIIQHLNHLIWVINEVEVLVNDVNYCNEDCKRVNCNATYDAIMSTLKTMYDSILMCCKNNDFLLIIKDFKIF